VRAGSTEENLVLLALAILLVYQCVGEGIAFLTGWPVPGPVIGMLLLFASLLAFPRLHDLLEQTASELLRHLSLLFVPAGVGIIVAAASGRGQWWAIALALVCSTLLTLAVTALVMQALLPKAKDGDDAQDGDMGFPPARERR
jgi:putative effector of murein hydrolase LrgA (UPF0299 family)